MTPAEIAPLIAAVAFAAVSGALLVATLANGVRARRIEATARARREAQWAEDQAEEIQLKAEVSARPWRISQNPDGSWRVSEANYVPQVGPRSRGIRIDTVKGLASLPNKTSALAAVDRLRNPVEIILDAHGRPVEPDA